MDDLSKHLRSRAVVKFQANVCPGSWHFGLDGHCWKFCGRVLAQSMDLYENNTESLDLVKTGLGIGT